MAVLYTGKEIMTGLYKKFMMEMRLNGNETWKCAYKGTLRVWQTNDTTLQKVKVVRMVF